MTRVVLPLVPAADVSPVATLNIIDPVTTADVRVAIEIVVDVDVDVIASPAGVPAPPAASPGSADGNSNAERDRARRNHSSRRRRVVDWRVRVNRSAVNNRGTVGGHIDHLRIRL